MNTDILNRLADVEPPLPPDYRAWYVGAISVCIIAVTGLLAWHFGRQLKSTTVKQDCADAANAVSEFTQLLAARSSLDSRLFAYRLATLLRLGLNLPQLTAECPACVSIAREQWPQIVTTLQQLRYAERCANTLDDSAIATIRTWLTSYAQRRT